MKNKIVFKSQKDFVKWVTVSIYVGNAFLQ